MNNIDKILEHTATIFTESTALYTFSRLEFDRIMNVDITNNPELSGKVTLFLNAMELVRECSSEIREACNDIQSRANLLKQFPIEDNEAESEVTANAE